MSLTSRSRIASHLERGRQKIAIQVKDCKPCYSLAACHLHGHAGGSRRRETTNQPHLFYPRCCNHSICIISLTARNRELDSNYLKQKWKHYWFVIHSSSGQCAYSQSLIQRLVKPLRSGFFCWGSLTLSPLNIRCAIRLSPFMVVTMTKEIPDFLSSPHKSKGERISHDFSGIKSSFMFDSH